MVVEMRCVVQNRKLGEFVVIAVNLNKICMILDVAIDFCQQ